MELNQSEPNFGGKRGEKRREKKGVVCLPRTSTLRRCHQVAKQAAVVGSDSARLGLMLCGAIRKQGGFIVSGD